MEKLLERYITVFDDIYEGKAYAFDEEEGRKRNNERMDIVIDYLGECFVVELKIWHGKTYHEKGEIQLADDLDYYYLDKGYMLTYSFNKKKNNEFTKNEVNGKTLIEAFV